MGYEDCRRAKVEHTGKDTKPKRYGSCMFWWLAIGRRRMQACEWEARTLLPAWGVFALCICIGAFVSMYLYLCLLYLCFVFLHLCVWIGGKDIASCLGGLCLLFLYQCIYISVFVFMHLYLFVVFVFCIFAFVFMCVNKGQGHSFLPGGSLLPAFVCSIRVILVVCLCICIYEFVLLKLCLWICVCVCICE